MAYRDTLNQQTDLLSQQNFLLNMAFLQAGRIHPMITVVWLMFLTCLTPFLLIAFAGKVLSFAVHQFDKACELKAARDRLAMLERFNVNAPAIKGYGPMIEEQKAYIQKLEQA